MSLDKFVTDSLLHFVSKSGFSRNGAVVTDLDGTALHEDAGRIYIPKPVEFGLKTLHDLGRPFVLNTLRFPLSVLRTFGRDWYGISNSPIPTITLNGSLLGYVTQTVEDEMEFEEIAAFPLAKDEIVHVLDIVSEVIEGGMKNLLLFYYPRDWRVGEVIWTPVAEHVLTVKEKYVSASSVTAVELPKLRDVILSEDICMIFVLIEASDEQLMAYQHTRRDNFFTSQNVNKLTGARRMAEKLGFDLGASLGAGDTEFDRFLSGVGLAVIVGPLQPKFEGVVNTVRLKNSFELGELLFSLAGIVKGERQT